MATVHWIDLSPDISWGIPSNSPDEIREVLKEAERQGLFFWRDGSIVYANDWQTIEKIEGIAKKHGLYLE